MIKRTLRFLSFILVSGISLPASAVTLGFDCISGNLTGDCAIGESQLSVELSDPGSNQVLFTFYNSGPDASSITGVYFDDGTLFGIASLIDADDGTGGDSGVDFSEDASPGNLPAAQNITPAFETTSGFLADSDPPVQPGGVNPGESLGILFDLKGGMTFADTVAALGTDLRIGIHVQGFETGGSESFVAVVPVPAAAWLLVSGLLGLAAVARRKT